MFALETHLALSVIIPLIGGLGVAALGSMPNLRETVTLGTAGLLFLNVMVILQAVMAGTSPEVSLVSTLPGIDIALKVNPSA